MRFSVTTTAFVLFTPILTTAQNSTSAPPLNFNCSSLTPPDIPRTTQFSRDIQRVSKAAICPSDANQTDSRCRLYAGGKINLTVTTNDTRIGEPKVIIDMMLRYMQARGIDASVETFTADESAIDFDGSNSRTILSPGQTAYYGFTPKIICFRGRVEMNEGCDGEGVSAVRDGFEGRGLEVCVNSLTKIVGRYGNDLRADGRTELVRISEEEARREGMDVNPALPVDERGDDDGGSNESQVVGGGAEENGAGRVAGKSSELVWIGVLATMLHQLTSAYPTRLSTTTTALFLLTLSVSLTTAQSIIPLNFACTHLDARPKPLRLNNFTHDSLEHLRVSKAVICPPDASILDSQCRVYARGTINSTTTVNSTLVSNATDLSNIHIILAHTLIQRGWAKAAIPAFASQLHVPERHDWVLQSNQSGYWEFTPRLNCWTGTFVTPDSCLNLYKKMELPGAYEGMRAVREKLDGIGVEICTNLVGSLEVGEELEAQGRLDRVIISEEEARKPGMDVNPAAPEGYEEDEDKDSGVEKSGVGLAWVGVLVWTGFMVL